MKTLNEENLSEEFTVALDLAPYTFRLQGSGNWVCDSFTPGFSLEVPERWQNRIKSPRGVMVDDVWVWVDQDGDVLTLRGDGFDKSMCLRLFADYIEAFYSIGWEALQPYD